MRISWLDWALLVGLVIATLAVRLPVAVERKIMPAGDVFNFQHITTQIQHFSYPIKEKRLPVYPILLLPGRWVGFDPVDTSVSVSLLAGAGIIALLYLLGRELSIRREALLLFLGLAMFDDLLVVNGIRGLADSTFVFFVVLTVWLATRIIARGSSARRRDLLGLGVATTLMMFTRYEGFVIAGLVIPLLLIKVPWRQVAVAAAIPAIAAIAWIPAHISIHGSLSGLSYVVEARTEGAGFGEFSLLPDNAYRMMNGAGWAAVWDHPALEVTQTPRAQAAERIVSSAGWWLSLVSLLGILWLLVTERFKGLLLIVSAVGYTLLLSWWWVYSRYVAPLSAVFYLTAAAGLSGLLMIADTQLQARPQVRLATTSLAIVGSIYLLATIAPIEFKSALSRAWERNQEGYALFQAVKAASQHDGVVAYYTEEHAFATLYLGHASDPVSFTNPGRGFFLSRFPEDTVEQLIARMRERNVQYVVESGDDPRVGPLVSELSRQHIISDTQTYFETDRVSGVVARVPVHQLRWQ